MRFQECQHVLANGNTCHAPRLQNQRFCYFHVAARDRLRRQRLAAERNLPLQVPVLEDEMTIQLALSDVVNAMLSDRIDTKKAALTLYALQTASANLKGMAAYKPETYREYQPELDASLPEINPSPVAAEPPQEAASPAPESATAAAPRQDEIKIPPKKPVASAPPPKYKSLSGLDGFLLKSKKKELASIRRYAKAFAEGKCEALPAIARSDAADIAEIERVRALQQRANR